MYLHQSSEEPSLCLHKSVPSRSFCHFLFPHQRRKSPVIPVHLPLRIFYQHPVTPNLFHNVLPALENGAIHLPAVPALHLPAIRKGLVKVQSDLPFHIPSLEAFLLYQKSHLLIPDKTAKNHF